MFKGRVVVTSVVRRAGQEQASGFLRVLDLASGRILAHSPVPESAYRARDPNPRGGLRGARGVARVGDRLVVANAERLLVVDPSWRLVRDLTHPLMGGVHDIWAEADGVWVTCTMADLLLKVSWAGQVLAVWDWRHHPALTAAFGYPRLPPVDPGQDYRDPAQQPPGPRDVLHLNAVTRDGDGLLVSFGRVLPPAVYRKRRTGVILRRGLSYLGFGRMFRHRGPGASRPMPAGKIRGCSSAIYRLDAAGRPRLLRRVDGIDLPNHNAMKVENWLVFNDTNGSRTVATGLGGDARDLAVEIPGQPSFVRGLAHAGGFTFLVGSQRPAAIYAADLRAGRVVAHYPLGGEPNESVYGLCLLSPEFADPPPRLTW